MAWIKLGARNRFENGPILSVTYIPKRNFIFDAEESGGEEQAFHADE